jgi:hypothetical protein
LTDASNAKTGGGEVGCNGLPGATAEVEEQCTRREPDCNQRQNASFGWGKPDSLLVSERGNRVV